MSQDDKPKVDVSVVQVLGSALAAVSSAVLLSTVGVAGTLIGAAVGSVIATVGGAVYAYSLDVSRRRVAAAAQLAAAARLRRGEAPNQRLATQELPAAEAPAQDPVPGPSGQGRPRWREALANLNWKRVAVASLGVFLATMAIIVAFELAAGRPVSTFTGGTDSTHSGTTLGGSSEPGSTPTPAPTPTPTPTSSTTPSADEPSTSPEPTETPDESLSVAPSEPSTPTATPTEDPVGTDAPTAAPNVSAPATPAD